MSLHRDYEVYKSGLDVVVGVVICLVRSCLSVFIDKSPLEKMLLEFEIMEFLVVFLRVACCSSGFVHAYVFSILLLCVLLHQFV